MTQEELMAQEIERLKHCQAVRCTIPKQDSVTGTATASGAAGLTCTDRRRLSKPTQRP